MSDETFVSELFDGEYWLTPDDLASWLKLKKDWIYDSVQQDQIPYHRFGRQLRFRHSEIQVWLQDRRPANSIVTITVTLPGQQSMVHQVDLRELIGDLYVPRPTEEAPATPEESPAPPTTMPVDEAGMDA